MSRRWSRSSTAASRSSSPGAMPRRSTGRGVQQSQFDNAAVYSPRGIGARAHRFICTPPGGGHATLIYGLMRTPVIQRVGLFAPPGKVRDQNRGYYATDLLTLFRLMFEGDFHVADETLYFHRDTVHGQAGAGAARGAGCVPSARFTGTTRTFEPSSRTAPWANARRRRSFACRSCRSSGSTRPSADRSWRRRMRPPRTGTRRMTPLTDRLGLPAIARPRVLVVSCASRRRRDRGRRDHRPPRRRAARR